MPFIVLMREYEMQWGYTPLIEIIRNYAKIGNPAAAELMRRLIFTYGCDVNIADQVRECVPTFACLNHQGTLS